MNRCKKGFTLIELLVVIAIIAILASILFPVFSQAREKARQATCISNLKQIGLALMMYAQDWDDTLPFWRTPCANDPNFPRGGLMWTEQLMPYVKNADIFRCPSANQEWEWPANCYPGSVGRPENNMRCNYGYNEIIMNGINGYNRLSSLGHPAETVVIGDCWNNFLTPWERLEPGGIVVRVAFANYNWNGDIVTTGGADSLTVPLDAALDHARHSEGAVLVFADGHAKWYRGDQIKDRYYGGTLRFLWP